MASKKIIYGDWRVTNFRGKAHATTGTGDRKRRFSLDIEETAPEKFIRAALIKFVQGREAQELRTSSTTVGGIYQSYIASKQRQGKVSWKKGTYYWKALEPWFDAVDPLNITEKLCQDYAAERAKQGKAPDTIWSELSEISNALKWARKQRIISEDIEIWRPRPSEGRDRVASPSEVKALLSAVDEEKAPHIKTVLLLAILTGARKTAILELTWDRVDFERQVIRYRAEDVDTYNPLIKGFKKGRAEVPMSGLLQAYLWELKQKAATDYVVEWGSKKVGSIKTAFNKVRERSGVKDVTLHTLRHTLSSWASNEGVEDKHIGQVLGHAPGSKVTRKTYIHNEAELVRPVIDLIERKMTG